MNCIDYCITIYYNTSHYSSHVTYILVRIQNIPYNILQGVSFFNLRCKKIPLVAVSGSLAWLMGVKITDKSAGLKRSASNVPSLTSSPSARLDSGHVTTLAEFPAHLARPRSSSAGHH